MNETKQTELVTTKKRTPAKNNPKVPAVPENQNDKLLMLAIQGNLDVTKLEKLIELKNREEERKAKQEFDRHFAEMQKQFEAAQRTKKGYNYKYAPIEELQKQFGPLIAEHGFSYRWREEAIEGGKRCIMKISGWGHSEENYFDIPDLEGTSQMNNVQVRGAMSTYGRRYSFIAGFGLIIQDEDTDGSFEDGVAYAEFIRKLDEQTDIEALLKTGREMYSQLRKEKDFKGAEIIMKATTRRKETVGGAK